MHAGSAHALSLRPVLETEFAKSLPDRSIGEARGGFLLSYVARAGGLDVMAERNGRKASARIEWAFGAGNQGVTPVAIAEGRWLEHRISYYTDPGRFDLTLGHAAGVSRSPQAAIGVEQRDETIRACFACHATVAKTELRVEKAGVDCVRCHAGAREHALGGKLPVNPAKLTAMKSTELCAACHRLTPPNGNTNDPLNIRFQPLRLIKSRCFQSGRLTCGTCHRAHENARRMDASFYRDKCVSCHAKPHDKGDCLTCHMPKSSPAPYLTFTDHFIRRRK